MNILIYLTIFVFREVYAYSPNISAYENWFTQKLDHSNSSDLRTWNQRYFVNDEYYIQGGPVFLMIGGEATAEWMWLQFNGSMADYARALGSLCFMLEHRFYDKSQPSSEPDAFRYLSSTQALEDLATFIVAMNKKYKLSQRTKWIAFGCSYPGNLAAWIRLKHPELVHGAVASSSPLRAVVEYSDYFRVVGEDINIYNRESYVAVKRAFTDFDRAMKSQNGMHTLTQKFKLCTPLHNYVNNTNDIAGLYFSLLMTFATVQSYRKNSNETLSFDKVCNIMANKNLGHPLDRLAAVNSLALNELNATCRTHDSVQEVINPSIDTAWLYQWLYQTCTEFGYYPTSSASAEVFGNKIPLMFFIQRICQAKFGEKYNLEYVTNAVRRTNSIYGGKNIKVSNVVFIQGSLDPWHPAGLTESVNPHAPVIFIKGTSHCSDFRPEEPDDLPKLKEARREVQRYISSWIH